MKEKGHSFRVSFAKFYICIALTLSVMLNPISVRPSQAYTCSVIVCELSGTNGAALSSAWADLVGVLNAAQLAIIAKWDAELLAFENAVLDKIDEVEYNLLTWLDMWWFYDFRPTLQDMTGQIVTSHVQQSRAIGSFFDAQQQTFRQLDLQLAELKSQIEYRSNEQVCVHGTMGGGLTRANTIRKAMNFAAPKERIKIGTNTVGTSSEEGKVQDYQVRWDEYLARYCNPLENNNQSACVAAMPFEDQDIQVTRILFEKDTIDVTDADIKKTVDDLIRNLIEPRVLDAMPDKNLKQSDGQQDMLQRRALMAQRGVAYEAVDHIVSRRMPGGSGLEVWTDELRQMAGIDALNISDNPSYEEIVNTITNEKFETGRYHNGMIEDSVSVARELAVLQAWYVIQQHDYLDLMDRFSMVLATQLANEIRDVKQMNTASLQSAN